MASFELFGTRYLAGEDCPLPTPANHNGGIFSEGDTPAGALQFFRRVKERMRREIIADFRLRNDPDHRMLWESVRAAEQCLLWQHFREREG